MSYGIVRVKKFKGGGVTGIQIHDQREKDKSHTNKDIDWTKTDQNYDLALENDLTFQKRIKEKIDGLNLKRAVRKDAVKMVQCLVTSDKEFFDKLSPEETKQFFKDSYDFLADRYGKDNIVSSIVHMDETTPHMHFNFVPITDDRRLSGKTVINRLTIIKLHDDFAKTVGKKYGLERGERREANEPPKKHLSVAEFKKQTESEVNDLRVEVGRIKKTLKHNKDVSELEIKSIPFGDKVSINKSDIDWLMDTSSQMPVLALELAKIQENNRLLQADLDYYKKANKTLIKKQQASEKENTRLKAEILDLRGSFDNLNNYLSVLEISGNTDVYKRCSELFEENAGWNDLSKHLERIKRPLSEENITNHVNATTPNVLKLLKFKDLSEYDIKVAQKLGLKSLKRQLDNSSKLKFNENTKNYEDAPEPKIIKPKPPQLSR